MHKHLRSSSIVSIVDDQGRLVEFNLDQTGYMRTAKFSQTFQNGNLMSYCQTEYILEGVPEPVSYASASRHFMRKLKNTWNWKDGIGVWQSRNLAQNAYTFDKVGNRLTNVITEREPIHHPIELRMVTAPKMHRDLMRLRSHLAAEYTARYTTCRFGQCHG